MSRLSIRARLALLCALGAAALTAVVTVILVWTLGRGLTRNLDTALTTRAGDTVAALQADPGAPVTTETSAGILTQVLSASGTVQDGADVLGGRSLLTPDQLRRATTATVALDRSMTIGSSTGDADTRNLRVVAVPGPGSSVIAAAASRDTIDQAVTRAGLLSLGLDLVLVAASGAAAWLLARAALRPVESMRRQAAELPLTAAGDGITVPGRDDELGRLATTFNALLGRLHTAVERERAFVADAGHELRTPLTVLKGEVELARRPGRRPDEVQAMLSTVAYETDRLVQLAEDLLTLGSSAAAAPTATVEVSEVVGASVAALTRAAGERGVTITVDAAPVTAAGDHRGLRRAVDNVLTNALRHTPPGSTIDVAVWADAGNAHIVIRDHGPGFDTAFMPRAFDRFTQASEHRHRDLHTTLPPGTGLGLAIVRDVLHAHGGAASAGNHPGGGAVVHLTWPLHTQPAPAPDSSR